MQDVTRLLVAWRRGDRGAFDALVPLVYDDLRRRAHAYLRQERSGHTLQTTGLVHEAFIKLVKQDRAAWETRSQFLAVAGQVMRRILVDYAREKNAAKRGDGQAPVTLDDSIAASASQVDVLALDQALERLAALDARQAQIVELRYFAGSSVEETADALGISAATVKREWTTARAWLFRELGATS